MKSVSLGEKRLVSSAAVCFGMLLAATVVRAQETKEKVIVDDVERSFMVRLPRSYDAQQHYPVVILLHGMNQDADDMERLTQFDQVADKDGIIAIYPIALHGRWNVGVRPQGHRPMGMGQRAHLGLLRDPENSTAKRGAKLVMLHHETLSS